MFERPLRTCSGSHELIVVSVPSLKMRVKVDHPHCSILEINTKNVSYIMYIFII